MPIFPKKDDVTSFSVDIISFRLTSPTEPAPIAGTKFYCLYHRGKRNENGGQTPAVDATFDASRSEWNVLWNFALSINATMKRSAKPGGYEAKWMALEVCRRGPSGAVVKTLGIANVDLSCYVGRRDVSVIPFPVLDEASRTVGVLQVRISVVGDRQLTSPSSDAHDGTREGSPYAQSRDSASPEFTVRGASPSMADNTGSFVIAPAPPPTDTAPERRAAYEPTRRGSTVSLASSFDFRVRDDSPKRGTSPTSDTAIGLTKSLSSPMASSVALRHGAMIAELQVQLQKLNEELLTERSARLALAARLEDRNSGEVDKYEVLSSRVGECERLVAHLAEEVRNFIRDPRLKHIDPQTPSELSSQRHASPPRTPEVEMAHEPELVAAVGARSASGAQLPSRPIGANVPPHLLAKYLAARAKYHTQAQGDSS